MEVLERERIAKVTQGAVLGQNEVCICSRPGWRAFACPGATPQGSSFVPSLKALSLLSEIVSVIRKRGICAQAIIMGIKRKTAKKVLPKPSIHQIKLLLCLLPVSAQHHSYTCTQSTGMAVEPVSGLHTLYVKSAAFLECRIVSVSIF